MELRPMAVGVDDRMRKASANLPNVGIRHGHSSAAIVHRMIHWRCIARGFQRGRFDMGTRLKRLILILPALMIASLAQAQAPYPAKPIRLIVPYPPGGTTDIVAREVGGKIAEGMGTQILVDNRPGGGTFIGLTAGAKAPPDGYTLTFGTSAGLAVNPALGVKMPFDPQRDFAPIGIITFSPFFLVIHPSLPVRNVKELVALAKAHPGKLNFASPGV